MKNIGQLLLGLLTAVGSIALVISAASLSILEGGTSIALAVTSQPTLAASTPVPVATGLSEPAGPTTPTIPPTATATEIQPTACPAPKGWNPYVVQPGDTLEGLAKMVGTTAEKIRKANCLTVSSLVADTILNLPVAPTATVSAPDTPTPLPTIAATATFIPPTVCAPPTYWVVYIVRPGDTLFRLGVLVGLTTDALQSANCLASDQIYVGQRLFLPFIPARPSATPTSTATQVPDTDTPVPTRTRTAPRPTATPVTPTITSLPTATHTYTPTSTAIPTPTDTLTPLPSPTDMPTATEEATGGLIVDTDTPTP